MSRILILLTFLLSLSNSYATDSVQAVSNLPIIKKYSIEPDSITPLTRVASIAVSPSEALFLIADEDQNILFLYDSLWHLRKILRPELSFADSIVSMTNDLWRGTPLVRYHDLTPAQQARYNNYYHKSRFSRGVFLSDTEIMIVGRINTFTRDSTGKEGISTTYMPSLFKYNVVRDKYTIYPTTYFAGKNFIKERLITYLPNSNQLLISTANIAAMRSKAYDKALAIGVFDLKGHFVAPFCNLPKEAEYAGLDYGEFKPSAIIGNDGKAYVSFSITPEIYKANNSTAYTLQHLPITNTTYFKEMAEYRNTHTISETNPLPWDSLLLNQRMFITALASTGHTHLYAILMYNYLGNIYHAESSNLIQEYKEGLLKRVYAIPPTTEDGGVYNLTYLKKERCLLEFRQRESGSWSVVYTDWR